LSSSSYLLALHKNAMVVSFNESVFDEVTFIVLDIESVVLILLWSGFEFVRLHEKSIVVRTNKVAVLIGLSKFIS